MKTKVFVSGILIKDGKILIIKRNFDAPRFANTWDLIGGHLQEHEFAEECIVREAKEETGLDVRIAQTGEVIEYNDEYGRSISIPFLLETDSDDVKLSYEHSDFKWVNPEEIENYDDGHDILRCAKIFNLVK